MPAALWRLLKKLKAYFPGKKITVISVLIWTPFIFILQLRYLPSYSFSFTLPPPLHLVPFQSFSSRGISCHLRLPALSVMGKGGLCLCSASFPAVSATGLAAEPPASFTQANVLPCLPFAPAYSPLCITPLQNKLYPFSPNTRKQMQHEQHQIRWEVSCWGAHKHQMYDGRAVPVATMPVSVYRSLLLARGSYQSEGLSLLRAWQAHLFIAGLVSRLPRHPLLPG